MQDLLGSNPSQKVTYSKALPGQLAYKRQRQESDVQYRILQSNFVTMGNNRATENYNVTQPGIKSNEPGAESSIRHAENMSYKSGQLDSEGEGKNSINIFNNLQIYLQNQKNKAGESFGMSNGQDKTNSLENLNRYLLDNWKNIK